MGYVIYDLKTTRRKGKVYKTMAAAKSAITRWSKVWWKERYLPLYPQVNVSEDPIFQYGIALDDVYFSEIARKVERKNLMTGELYWEDINTPPHMSPSMETYWSQ